MIYCLFVEPLKTKQNMKKISEISHLIEDLQERIIKQRLVGQNDLLFNCDFWPFLLEFFESANEVQGFEIAKSSLGVFPRPVFVEGYSNKNFFANFKSEILKVVPFYPRYRCEDLFFVV